MTRQEAESILARGGTTDLDGFLRVYEAQLLVWGYPEEERKRLVQQFYEEHSGLAPRDAD
jgi:hypothetical protein